MEATTYNRTKTTDFFYKINTVVYFLGHPQFWIEKIRVPEKYFRFYDWFTIVANSLVGVLVCFEIGAFFTQHNLTEKQKNNRYMYGISHPLLFSFHFIMAHHAKKIKSVFYSLAVALKSIYNDPEVEKKMIRQTELYLMALLIGCGFSMVMYTVDACWEMVKANTTFTSIVTAYPDAEDRSDIANVIRVIFYFIWWIFFSRILGVYALVVPMTICLSHQYINLQSYFRSLSDIFEESAKSQAEMEAEYEAAFKLGIKMHATTLRCVHQTQTVCGLVFSGQILFNVSLLVLLMAQVVNSERNLVNLVSAVTTAAAVLISTGFYMWNAGDVTVEAAALHTAMYCSGWHHCQGQTSVRIRKLAVIAMAHAQQPVILKGMDYIELSYESYINIVRSSYSVFSVLY